MLHVQNTEIQKSLVLVRFRSVTVIPLCSSLPCLRPLCPVPMLSVKHCAALMQAQQRARDRCNWKDESRTHPRTADTGGLRQQAA